MVTENRDAAPTGPAANASHAMTVAMQAHDRCRSNAFITSPVESTATLALILLGLPVYPLFHGKGTHAKTPAVAET